jgi:ATP-binding cassette subfamily B multidrug efflux pump
MSGKSNDDQILGQEPRENRSVFPGNPGRLRNSGGSEQCAGARTSAKAAEPRRGAPMDRFPGGPPGRPPGRTPGRPPGGGGHRGFGMPVQKAKDFKGTLKRLARYIKPRTIPLFTVFTFAALSTVFSILSPKIMGKATTKLFHDLMLKMSGVSGAAVDFAYIGRILSILSGLYVLSALFSYIQHYIMAGVAQATVYEMRRDVEAKLNRLPLEFFDGQTHGEILSRVVNDVDNVSSTLQQSLTQIITAVVTLFGVVIMMLTISPLLTLITMVTLPLSGVVTALVAKRSQKYFAGQQRVLGELNGHVEEMYTGHRIVKAFGREKASIKQFKEINQRLYDHGWKAQFMSGLMMPLMGFINNIGYVIVSVAGGLLVLRQAIEIGDIQAFISYSRQFTQPIAQTAGIANIIQSTIASAERVFEILDEDEEIPDPVDAEEIEFPAGKVEFQGVRFGYEEGDALIENMSISAKPGQAIAIVGPTGAGKTTLVNLLMRFYEVDDGTITVDGVDIRDLSRGGLRKLFGMVLQDTWLFNGTIRENIAYGREGATEAEIVRAARAARADHFIRTLPDGYDTVLGEDASNISQGQKQLLTIARAILADPPILILDEATSSVDTRTELQIQKAMKTLMRGRTSFVIAHRLSTIRDADLILVMDNGSIIEQGKHSELLAKGGFYADLYNSQFTGRNAVNKAV